MGMQVAVVMSAVDEREFLAFLRSTAPLRVFRASAPDRAALEIDDLAATPQDCRQFHLWNTAFDWKPDIAPVADDAPAVERRGWVYLRHPSRGPALEYDRAGRDAQRMPGRVYWAKHPVSGYDLAAFQPWYEAAVRWIQRHGRRLEDDRRGPWYLPDAWAQRSH